jgi:hypothetical protein
MVKSKLSISQRFLKISLYFLVSGSDTNVPPFFLMICCVFDMYRWSVFQNHVFKEVKFTTFDYYSSNYTLHFTFICTFAGRGANYRKRIIFRAA